MQWRSMRVRRTSRARAHLQGGLGERVHAHKPLLAHERLHDVAAALRARHAHRVRLLLQRQPLCLIGRQSTVEGGDPQ